MLRSNLTTHAKQEEIRMNTMKETIINLHQQSRARDVEVQAMIEKIQKDAAARVEQAEADKKKAEDDLESKSESAVIGRLREEIQQLRRQHAKMIDGAGTLLVPGISGNTLAQLGELKQLRFELAQKEM